MIVWICLRSMCIYTFACLALCVYRLLDYMMLLLKTNDCSSEQSYQHNLSPILKSTTSRLPGPRCAPLCYTRRSSWHRCTMCIESVDGPSLGFLTLGLFVVGLSPSPTTDGVILLHGSVLLIWKNQWHSMVIFPLLQWTSMKIRYNVV